MKLLLIIILFLLQAPSLFAQEKGYIKKGNELYQQQKYKEAESNYRRSVDKKSQNLEGNFNLGDALYKQKKYADAGQQFNKIAAAASSNKKVLGNAYHNLGNSLLQSKKLEESIEAYKKALINNPKDEETRYNLAYAQELLKQQQQKNKQDQDKKNKQGQDKKDQDKNRQNKDKQNNGDDKQDKKEQDKKEQDKQKPQPDRLSKEDAERMLDALNNEEKQTQDKLKNKKLKGARITITKDW